MDNFRLLSGGFDTTACYEELKDCPLWDAFTLRQNVDGSAHRDTKCIPLYAPMEFTHESIYNDLDAFETIFVAPLSHTMNLFDKVIQSIGWEDIGRVMLVDLKAGGHINRHADSGAYAEYYDRIHLVIKSEPGNVFTCGGESRQFEEGELFQFNHLIEHEVDNHSNSPRLHMIIDIKGVS